MTLTARTLSTPFSFFAFRGWSGPCSGTGTCTVTIDAAKTVTAAYEEVSRQSLSVVRNGNGQGTVTSTPPGINCGLICAGGFPDGSMVVLTATPASNSTFAGWSGPCTGTAACTVTMSASQSVTATFTRTTYPLTASTDGTGGGSVTSTPAGIACPGDCAESYQPNTPVTLTATPDATSTFAGWSGACTGTAACTVTMSEARNVSATFTRVTHVLTIVVAGTGNGSVVSTPGGIVCPADCDEAYAMGSLVTLNASADASSAFTGWGGPCAGTVACVMLMDQARSVSASFEKVTYPLTITRAGSGGGAVSSTSGIACPPDCSEDYAAGTVVSLAATADLTSAFAGWSGPCTGTVSCTVTMDQARAVTATFTLLPGATPAGTGVTVAPIDPGSGTSPVTLTFASVVAGGVTTVRSGSTGPAMPTGYSVGSQYFDVTTTANYAGPISICFAPPGLTSADRLIHWTAGVPADVTVLPVDLAHSRICGTVTSLSPFAVGRIMPPQAHASLQRVGGSRDGDDHRDRDDEDDALGRSGRYRVGASCTNGTLQTAVLNGVAVTNGQIVLLKFSTRKLETRQVGRGTVVVRGSRFELVVSCAGTGGLTDTETVTLMRPASPGGGWDERHDRDDHGRQEDEDERRGGRSRGDRLRD